MQPLFDFLLRLVKKGWTGKIVLNFHKGKFMKATEGNHVMTIEVGEEKEVKI